MAIYELEDRIFFDGAMSADIMETEDASSQDTADTLQSNDNITEQNNENVSIAPSVTTQNSSGEQDTEDSADNCDSSSETAEPDIVSADNTDEIILSLAGIEDIEIPEGYEIPSNVLILSSECSNYNEIINSVKENTIIIEYDSNDTLESVLQELKEVLADKQAVNIGIIESENLELSDLSTSSGLSEADFMNELSDLQTIDGVINEIDLESVSTDAQNSVFAEYFDISSPEFDTLCESVEDPTEIIFINSSVMNAEEIVDDLPENAEIVYLESGEDGIQQITDYLADKTDIDTIRIISHGNDGYIVLNGEIIDADYLAENSDVIAAWKNALSENADIMLYGCNVAGSEAGEAFVQQLGILTGADVAAASIATGGVEANWNLDFNYGEIEAVDLTIDGYEYQLDNQTVTSTADDGSAGTLRYAVANVGVGGEITFAYSNMTITLNGAEITINKSMTISGRGMDNTVIEGAASYNTASNRVFMVQSEASDLIFKNLTISNGGKSDDLIYGSAIHNGYADLTLDNVKITRNYGGAAGIAVLGSDMYLNITIIDSEISYNIQDYSGFAGSAGLWLSTKGNILIQNTYIHHNSSNGPSAVDISGGNTVIENCTIAYNTITSSNVSHTDLNGAGIHATATSTFTITNSTIAYNVNNTTSYSPMGGGIYFEGSNPNVLIKNTTIAYNSTKGYGGGIGMIHDGNTKITLKNTIIANNSATSGYADFYTGSSSHTVTSAGYNIIGEYNSNYYDFAAQDSTTYVKIGDDVYQNNNREGVKGALKLDTQLRDNGGDTLTLKLNTGSFAAAALPFGSNYYNNSPTTDQTGASRGSADYTSIGAVISPYTALYYRSSGTGDWEDSSNWQYSVNGSSGWQSAFTSPDYLDNTITITNGTVLTVNSNLTLDQTTIQSGSTIIVADSNILTVHDGTGTDISVAGTLINQGAIVNNGSVTVTGKYSHAGTISGTYLVYSGSSSTLEYSGSSQQTTSLYEFNTTNGPVNLIINNNSGVILSVNSTLSGNLSVENGNFNIGVYSLTVSGDITISSGASLSMGETHLDAANITSEGTITNSEGTITVTGDFTSTGTITNSGTIEVAGTVDLPSGSIGGTFVYSGISQTVDTDATYRYIKITGGDAVASGTLQGYSLSVEKNNTLDAESLNLSSINNSGTVSVSGTVDTGISIYTSGTFIYDGGDQTIQRGYYSTLLLQGTGTKTLSGSSANRVSTNLTIAEGVTLALANNSSLELEGTWTNNGSFSAGTNSTVKYTGYFEQTVIAENYYNLEVNVKSNSNSKSLAGNVEVSGDFTLNYSSYTNYQFSIGNYTLTVNGTSTINQTMVIGSSGQFNAIGTLTVTGGFLNSGTINASGSVTLPSDSTIGGNFVYNGSGTQTIASATYNNLVTSNGGLKTLGGDVSVTGVLTNEASTTLALSEYTLSVGGSWSNNGLFDAGTGTVNYNGEADQNIRVLDYYSLSINGSGNKTLDGDIEIAGNFTAGTTVEFVHNDHSVTYDGTDQTVAQVDYYDLIFSGSGIKSLEGATSVANNITLTGTSVTLKVGAYSLEIANALTIGSGQTLSISTGTVDVNGIFDATNGNVSFSGNGNLKLGAATVCLGTLSTDNGTVWYDGSTVQDILSTTYYNLKIDGDAAKSLAGNIDIKGSFTVGGTATFVHDNHSVTYSGTDQTVAQINYYDLSLSGSGTKSLAGTTSVENNITLSGSSITLSVGEYSLEVTNGMTIGSGQMLSISTGTVDVDGIFDATGGTISFSENGNIKIGSTVTSLGTLSTDNGTVWYDGASDQNILGDTYYNLKIVGDSTVKTLSGNVNIEGGFTVESGTFAHNDKTVTYGGSSQDIADVTYYNLVIAGTGTANGVADIIIDNNFELSQELTVTGLLSVGGSSEIGGNITTAGNQSYNSTVSINNSVTLDAGNADTITFTGAVSLGSNTLTVGSGNTGALNFTSTVDGAGGLNINTDAIITFGDAVGSSTALGNLTITQSGGTTFNKTVDAGVLTVTDTTGAVEFNGSLTLTALNTTAQDYAVKILDGGEITNAVTFINIGGVTIGDDALDTTIFHGGVTSTASIVSNSIAGTITVDAGNSISFGDTYATDNATLDGIISLENVTLSDVVTFTLGTGGNGNITVESITGTEGGDDSNIIVNTNGSFDLIVNGGGVTTGIGTVSITVGQLSTIDDEVNANGNFTKAGEGELKIETATFAVNNLEITEGTLTGGANITASVYGDLVIAESGTFNAFGTTIVHGNWDNDNGGTFNHCNGEVQFKGNGTTSYIYGANQWNNIISEHQINKTLIFESDKTQNIAGWMSFIGELDGSDIENNAYSVKVNNLTSVLEDTHCYAVTFAEISNCNSSSTVIASFSVDKGGNNSNWTFKKYYLWDGYGKDGNWNTGSNWGTSGLPEGDDPDVIINTQVNDGDPLVIGSNIKVGNMAIVSTKVLDFTDAGTLTITGGLYNMNGSIISSDGVDINIVSETVAGSETRVYTGIIACGGNLNIEANTIDITDDITAAEGKSITLNTVTAGGEDADEVGTGTITIYSDTEITTTDGGDIEFNGTIKGVVSDVGIWSSLTLNAGEGDNGGEVKIYGVEEEAPLGNLTVIAGNNSTYIYGDVYTTGDQSYTGHVVISADVTIQTVTGNIAFNGSVSGTTAGEEDVTIDAGTGSVTFYDTVGTGTDVSLGNLIISSSQGGTTFNNEVAAVSLTISDGGAVDISAAVNLNGAFSSAGTTFDNTGGVITATGITINHSGDVIVAANLSSGAGNVDIDSDSSITINAAISTTSGNVNIDSTGQTVLDLNSSLTSTSGNITFGGDKNGGTVLYKNFEFNEGITVTFNSALDSKEGESYSLNVLGNAVFAGGIGETTALSELSVGGVASISSSIITDGTQIYTDAVTLIGDSALTGTTVTFGSTITGTTAGVESLTITGDAVFGGNIGAIALETLSVSETTIINDNITLAVGTATFTGTVNSKSGENKSLEITGNAVFESSVGATDSLSSLTISGTTSIGADVTTTETQTYEGAATLTADTVTLTGTTITFESILDGSSALTISGDVSFLGDVGGETALTSLTILNGTTTLGGSITTEGIQIYNDIILSGTDGDYTLTSNSSDITVQGNITDNEINSLTFNVSGNAAVSQSSGKSIEIGGSLGKSGTGTFDTNGNDITAGGLIVSGGTFNSGSESGTWNINGNIAISTGAVFNATSGTFAVSGNWTNNGTFNHNNAAVILNGISEQQITSGESEFNIIELNNSFGAVLLDSMTVENELILTSGLLTIGTNMLTLNENATIGGTPSSSAMIVTNSTGSVRKKFNSTGSFVYTIGTNSGGSAVYSPMTVNFNSGTFKSGAFLDVRVINEKDPNNTSPSNYLNRYWISESYGITNFSVDVICQYAEEDVSGNESQMYFGKYTDSSWKKYDLANTKDHTISADGLTSFCTITGIDKSLDPDPNPEQVNLINDGTQFSTITPWTNTIDYANDYEETGFIEIGEVLDGEYAVNFESLDELVDINEYNLTVVSGNENMIKGFREDQNQNGSFISNVSLENNNESFGNIQFSFFNNHKVQINGEFNDLTFGTNTDRTFSNTGGIDILFNLEDCKNMINYEAIAAYNTKHPVFKSELDLLLEKF